MTDQPFVFGVDLDGVCADYYAGFGAHVARSKGKDPASLPPLTDYHDFSPWGITSREEFSQLHAEAVEDGLFASMPTIAGAPEALWRLSDQDVWIRVITHRLFRNGQHKATVASTISWLDGDGEDIVVDGVARDSRIPYRDLCFIGDKPDVGADIYIDDAPSNVEPLRAAGRETIVFDHKYNRHLAGPRATTWDEAFELVVSARDRWAEIGRPPVAAAS